MTESPSDSLPDPASRPLLDADALRLFLCGLAVLFWELALIRWLGANVRIVAYFSNLVLISAFFGLGVGALMTRFPWRLERLIAPLAAFLVLLAVGLGRFGHDNPGGGEELIWMGRPLGIHQGEAQRLISAAALLVLVYVATALVFAAFGQYVGRLFRTHLPLRAYTWEVAGSLGGIALFALLSHLQTSPSTWFAVGFALLVPLLPWRPLDTVVTVLLGVLVVAATVPGTRGYVWSPYYRIAVEPITTLVDKKTGSATDFPAPVGHVLAVNSDYHQMMLDLRPRPVDHAFLQGWRGFYDQPYRGVDRLPPGKILVVGAGTGNDVSAALRNTDREITAVEIDPAIASLGRRLHAEKPYDNPRVTLVIDDARSFFHRTDERYAMVVFGFLDSHRLLSVFSSVRLDNFIYTRESMREVRELVVPGGTVAVSFSPNSRWIHERLLELLNQSFDYETSSGTDPSGYANGVLYLNGVSPAGGARPAYRPRAAVPTDDWPFLYLRERTVPLHNVAFLVVAVALSGLALLLLPRGERRIRMPYLLLGAAFFLLETSNVVRMSLLYGSTWWVNTLVFAGILVLVLLSNLTASFWSLRVCVVFLSLGVLAAAWIPSDVLFALPPVVRAIVAVIVFLGPVYFGGLIFARLISTESRLFEAYGSNVLGAVLGGTAEYLSLLLGFRFLLALALVFYLVVYLLLRAQGESGPTGEAAIPQT